MKDEEEKRDKESDLQARDLSCGRFIRNPEIFHQLKVLLVSGAALTTDDLAKVLTWAPSLWKLDASYCGLSALPEPELWQRMLSIKSLLLHKNLLAKWQDVECAATPGNLEWLTLYGNPITSQPEYQMHVLRVATALVALDLRVLTDEEHLAAQTGQTGSEGRPRPTGSFRRFAANSEASAILFREKPPENLLDAQELLREAADELRQVYGKSAQCSAAFAIQGGWRVYKARSLKFSLSETQRVSAIRLQKCARKFLWKRAMQTYVEKFLAEEEGLDLLLSAQEMLTLRASKLIELSVRRWIRRRKNRQTVREAATIIARNVKGHLTRCKLLRKFLKLDTYKRIYFPASCTWEAIVLLNVARAACDMSPVPREYQFEAADVMAIRMVDSNEMPRAKSEVSRLLAFRNFSLLRPCHSGRYPSHLWDGPFHRLVPGGTPQRFLKAYSRVRRRAANVDNICRKVFLASCACGPHPIRAAPYEEGPFVVHEAKAPDFRELYTFGSLIGEGDFGIVYTCDVKLGGSAWDEELTRQAETRQNREDAAKEAEAADGKVMSLPQLLQERQRQQMQKMEKRLQRRRLEPSKPDIPASGLVVKMVDHASSWWGNLASYSLRKSHQGKSWLLLSQEVKKLSQLGHVNLVKTHTVFVDDYFVYFVISRFPCSLRDAVMQAGKFKGRGLPVSVAAYTADQLLAALAYLHAHNVAHRGITPNNLCVTTYDILKEPFTLVIADIYSTARGIEDGAFLTEVFGSPEYWAPEVAACEYTLAADVWAAGVVLWFAQTKKLPFTSLHNVMTKDVEPGVRLSRDVFESLACMLCRDVNKRVTAEEALRQDWLRESQFGPSQIQPRRDAVPRSSQSPKLEETEDAHESEDESDQSSASSTVFPTRDVTQIKERSASKKKVLRRQSATDFRQVSTKPRPGEEPSNWGRPKQAARLLPQKKQRADERFAMGEKVTVSFDIAIQRCRESMGGSLEPFVSYEWWSKERCQRVGLDIGTPPCTSGWWKTDSSTEGLVYVCPASMADLGKVLEVAAPELLEARSDTPESTDRVLRPFYFGGKSEYMDELYTQLKEGHCRLCLEGGRLCRVVDLVVLRVKSSSGKYLIGGKRIYSSPESRQAALDKLEEGNYSDDDGPVLHSRRAGITAAQVMVMNLEEQRAKPKAEKQDENPMETLRQWQFPTVHRPLGGQGVGGNGGMDELRQAIDAMIADQLRTKPDALHVFDSAAVETTYERKESTEFPGLLDLQRRHFFDAVVNEEAGRSKLSQIGIPGERSFQTSALPAEDVGWCWADQSDCERLGVKVQVDAYEVDHDKMLEAFRAIPAKKLRGKPLDDILRKYGFLRSNAAVSQKPLRTVARFAGEVARGQLRIWERKPIEERRPSELSPGFSEDGGELLLLEEILTLRVRSSKGNYLVCAKQCIEGEDMTSNKWSLFGASRTMADACFPEVCLKNGEDPVVAIRRVVMEHLNLSQAMPSCIVFGQKQLEEQRAQQSLAKLVVRQIVDVQLGEPDVPMLCCLMMPGMEREAEALGVTLERRKPRNEEAEDSVVASMMQELVEGADFRSSYPSVEGDLSPAAKEAQLASRAADKDPTLRRFLLEAWRLGSRPRIEEKESMQQFDPATGKKIYRDATWLCQPLVSCLCETPRLAERFILYMLHFAGTGGDAPLVRPVPFLPERFVKQASAVLRVQAAWRAHRERCSLSCNLKTAATIRRCALCIQRCWRWSLLKRRLELLQGAKRAAQNVRGTSLYIEERLLIALNLINSVNRYPPLFFESSHGFAVGDDEVVLAVQSPKPSTVRRVKDNPKEMKALNRASQGLPKWLCQVMGNLRSIPAEQVQVQSSSSSGVPGLHGLILQGMVEPRESDFITVQMPSLEHQAQGQHGEVKDPALLASRGTLRWAELRFKTLEQARRRAAILFLCSWSALHREAIPFVPKSMIQNVEVGAAVLRFWKVYGLTWAVGEKTSSHKLRNLAMKQTGNIVSLNGREPWSFVLRQEWLGMDRTGPSLSEKPLTVKEAFAGNKWGVSSSGLTGTGSPVPLRGARGTYRAGNTMLPPLPPTRPNSASARSDYLRTPTSYSTASPVSLSSSRASPRAAQLLNFEAQKLWGDALQDALRSPRRTPPMPPVQSPRSSRGTPKGRPRTSATTPRKTRNESPRC